MKLWQIFKNNSASSLRDSELVLCLQCCTRFIYLSIPFSIINVSRGLLASRDSASEHHPTSSERCDWTPTSRDPVPGNTWLGETMTTLRDTVRYLNTQKQLSICRTNRRCRMAPNRKERAAVFARELALIRRAAARKKTCHYTDK